MVLTNLDAEDYLRKLLDESYKSRKYECSKCLKRYKHKHILQRHMQFECGMPPQFTCSICGHRSRRLHSERYACEKCGRSYKHKTNLCNHIREECGKGPSYFCPICQKGFKKKQHMQRHIVVHNDWKQYMSLLPQPNKNRYTPQFSPAVAQPPQFVQKSTYDASNYLNPTVQSQYDTKFVVPPAIINSMKMSPIHSENMSDFSMQ
ncbi:hypothetical protein HHI36_020033 [Cryptolaemus montrouzieri]|uniref:C2H2-type domain-containing protein n=1 Tax=Cryptolaemus montrouzieri TaxID=559131 RepID=A0ABD2N9Q8_9CUCU